MAGEPGDQSANGAASVVLVDDVAELRSLYGTLLEKKGPFEVVAEAGDGRAGIEAVRDHDPDLVLLDLSMPDMDGLEALPEIQEVSPDTNVVVLSGFLDERVGEKARNLGAADFLEKGMDADEMLDRVSQAAEVDLDVEEPEAEDLPEPTVDPDPSEGDAGQEVEVLARGIRHDLQEPLEIMSSYLDLLEEDYREILPADAKGYIDQATDAADRMQTMIDSLGTYGALGQDVDPEERVDLAAVLDDVEENVRPRLEDPGVEFTRDPLPAEVAGDRGNLTRALQNLVSNALDYQEGSVRIHVGYEDRGDEHLVTVSDEGPGVRPGEQDEIFSPLRTGSAGMAADGTGMGLAICRRVVEQHGGEIGVDAEPGEGSTFWFTLPKSGDGPEGEAP